MHTDWSSILILLGSIEGGLFYLGHKYLTWKFEVTGERKYLIWAWGSYLIGTPGIVLMFILKHNWMFAGLEAGGIPLMSVGLTLARSTMTLDEIKEKTERLSWIAWGLTGIGIAYSFFDLGMMEHLTQWLEAGGVAGFFAGLIYQNQDKRKEAYLAYMLMIICTGILCWFEQIWFLVPQQLISFGFMYASLRRWKESRASA
jgi:hypothetical protein